MLIRAVVSSLLLGSALGAQTEVKAVGDDGRLTLADGRVLQLQGVALPSPTVRAQGMAKDLRAYLRASLLGRAVHVTDDGPVPGGGGEARVAVVRTRADGPSINAAVLRDGLAVFSCRTPKVTDKDALFAAARTAQLARRGWFARGAPRRLDGIPYLNGAVVGLHHQGGKWDYHRQLDELAEAGFRHVSLLYSAFVNKVDSVTIRRDHQRTVTDGRLIETIGYARKLGFSVMLLPIVLILEPGDEDWRGVLKPKDEPRWWLNYDAFLAHYLDIAEATGVDIVSIGSEFGSLEDRTATWQRIILNARGRYRGLLTYSANWDHGHVAQFFPSLDLVGMSAYFSLTEKKDPTVGELVAEWRRVAKDLAKLQARHGRPVIFTELGYASQDGINRDPWNYVMNEDAIDLQEQADCFEAFLRVAPEMKFLRGAFFYDYYDEGGPKDWSYSPRGKPAMAKWRAWAAQRRGG